MYFWFNLSCLTLCLLNNVIMEPRKFEFHLLALGHSGILITWKSNETLSKHALNPEQFNFYYRIKDANNTTFSKDKHNAFADRSYNFSKQYVIRSLEQNTLYEFVIEQFDWDSDTEEPDRKYNLEMKTNPKTNTKPAKPDFIWRQTGNIGQNNVEIQWLPCGRDRKCGGKEAGNHFAIKLKALDRRQEIKLVEHESDSYLINIFPCGIEYEVVVSSINGDSETDSDPQELYFQPVHGAVRSVEIISFSNKSILVSWNRPKYFSPQNFKSFLRDYRVGISNYPTNTTSYLRGIGVNYTESTDSTKVLFDKPTYQFTPGVTYTFIIVPTRYDRNSRSHGTENDSVGMEMQVQYTIPVNSDD